MTDFHSCLIEPGDPPSKREILACALRLFVRDGLCETGIRAIGEAAGYTNPALYKFFASKEALTLYLFERCYGWVYQRLEAGSRAERFDAGLAGVVRAWVELIEEQPDAVLYVNETLRELWPRARPATRRRSLLRLLRSLVEQGQAEGVVPRRLAPELGVALLVGTLGQVARQLALGDFKQGPRALEAQLTALLGSALTGGRP